MDTPIPSNEKERRELQFILAMIYTGISLFKRAGHDLPSAIVNDADKIAGRVVELAPKE